jgi:hypothetical protein
MLLTRSRRPVFDGIKVSAVGVYVRRAGRWSNNMVGTEYLT